MGKLTADRVSKTASKGPQVEPYESDGAYCV
jgi:hypothetical protein